MHTTGSLLQRMRRPQRIDEPDGRAEKERRHRRECGESRAAGALHLDQDRQMQGAPSGHIGEAKTHAHKIMETGGQTYIIAGLHYAWSRH